MAGPNGKHRHEPMHEVTTPTNRGSVDAYPTFIPITRGPSITPPCPFMPSVAPIDFVSEHASSTSSPFTLSSSTSCSDLPSLFHDSLVSPVVGTFAEVSGPFFAYPRAGHCELYSLTRGSINCFRDRNSSFRWLGFRNGDQQVEHVDRNYQFPSNPTGTCAREIMALYWDLLGALYTNYSGRHTTPLINAALNQIRPLIDGHLFSGALTLTIVHIIYDFLFLERHICDGKMVDVKVVVTIEFYQAPWRAGAKRWNLGGSLDCMSVNYHKTDVKVHYTFVESFALDPILDMQPQFDYAASSHAPHQPTALPADDAVNLDALMTYISQTTTTITPGPLNAASKDSRVVSSLASGFDLDADDVSITDRSMVPLNNIGIDLPQRTPSGTEALLGLVLFDNPSSTKGHLDMLQGSPGSSSFQQITQPSSVNDGTLAANMSDSILLSSSISAPQMRYDLISNLQDDDAHVVNLNDHQPATNQRPPVSTYSRAARTTSSNPSSTTNVRRSRNTASSPRGTSSRQNRITNPLTPTPMSTTPTNTTRSAKSFPCRYRDCTHKPFATKWSMETHANTHAGVRFTCLYCDLNYARPGDRTRHTNKVHLGYLYRCDHCQTERSRKPSDSRLDGCDNYGRKHRYQRYALPSVPTSAVTGDAP
ncbi:MAG: hypothetical protein JOS17DRAFT_779046 [Linnemannia elongata]|nr:MAG: hypothetical protein JOS17DRAFT_779046 [Linnemannia elongata]